MPFINRRQIALATRQKADRKYRDQLRRALQNPALTAEQRKDLRSRLERVGQVRVYDAASPPLPGAIELPSSGPVQQVARSRYSSEELVEMRKATLVALAQEAGVPHIGTKAAIIERLQSV